MFARVPPRQNLALALALACCSGGCDATEKPSTFADEPDDTWFFGSDCPPAAPPSVPTDAPRVLILGPGAIDIAESLQGMLAADPTFTDPVVTGQEIAIGPSGVRTLMNFFYHPHGRTERLAPLGTPLSHVVLHESDNSGNQSGTSTVIGTPEFFFEGVRTLGCLARAAGAEPIVLVPWYNTLSGWGWETPENVAELTHRVANGTRSTVAPAGTAWEAARSLDTLEPSIHAPFVAAATLYSTLTGQEADYVLPAIDPGLATQLAEVAHATVVSEADRVHYNDTVHGDLSVQLRSLPASGDLWFMASGSSSEQIWLDRMAEILPRAGLAPHGTHIGYTNQYKRFDQAGLDIATQHFEAQQYQILFVRSFEENVPEVDAVNIARVGGQTDLQVQVWDRYFDANDAHGTLALEMMATLSWQWKHVHAAHYRAAMIPFHLMFAKLKTARPSLQLLSDGVHLTYPVSYALATMSVVSRTGIRPTTDGLDSDTELAARLAQETIRQLSALSVTGEPIPDPNARTGPDPEPCLDAATNPGIADTTWVSICGSTFQMGSNDDPREQPVHAVDVPSFEMLQTEVTVSQYRACVAASACTPPYYASPAARCHATGHWANWEAVGREQYPINCLQLQQAKDACAWLGGRLPSESEWEFAARSGGQDFTYPWGDAAPTCELAVMPDEAGTAGCGTDITMAVCSKPAGNTTQGLCDMAGNLAEHVQDWRHRDYVGAPADGSAWDWGGGSVGTIRGGHSYSTPERLRVTDRSNHGARWVSGVRCVR